jgi:5'-phosphate synthase pdxT subunit
MSTPLALGVLAFHGDVSEHVSAMQGAASKLKINVVIREVRTKDELRGLRGLIIPGGESTTLQKLCEREGMFDAIKKIPHIMGTCAGAILLAKKVLRKAKGQRTLALMNIETDRNAYGRQKESSEKVIKSRFGATRVAFIRAPKITLLASTVAVLARNGNDIVACEERRGSHYYLALAFHPELSTTVFHEHFLQQAIK